MTYAVVVHRLARGFRSGRVLVQGGHMVELPAPVRDLLARQDGLATRAQLLDLELSTELVRWHSGRTWRVVLPHVLLVADGALTDRRRLVAGLLWAGPHSVLAGPTAARYHGVQAADPGRRVHLVVPATHRTRTFGFATTRRSHLPDPDVKEIGPIRVSSPARACVDAALATRSASTRVAILVEAVQRGITTVDDLTSAICLLRPRDAFGLKDALAAAGAGAWSVPEAELLDLVATSRSLPEPWANPSLVDAHGQSLLTPDAWFDDVAMAVLVHSHAHHSQGAEWTTTVERDGELVAAGVVVVGITPHGLRSDPAAVLQRLERTHAVAALRPRPSVLATRRAA